MKILKSISGLLLIAVLSVSLLFVTSCDEDEDAVVDKSELLAKLTDANNLIATTEEGTAGGQYSAGAQGVLQTTIDIAQTLYDNVAATQIEVDNTAIAITNAIAVYTAAEITPIAPDDLVGHWTFDDATGTTAKDYSGNSFDGIFKTGHTAFGAGTPAWATDRYGNANKAISFDQGAFVEVPYNIAINPKQITIAVWVNATESRENNRFLGLHSWNGFKFQLQSANKSFFTASAEDGIYDKDSDPPLDLDKWYHLAVTYGGGEMVFYVNGVKTQTWDGLTGDLVTVAGHNLSIGTGSSKYADVTTNYDTDKIIPTEWGGYFHGIVDELRMYKSVLTPTQIESIYNLEKVQD